MTSDRVSTEAVRAEHPAVFFAAEFFAEWINGEGAAVDDEDIVLARGCLAAALPLLTAADVPHLVEQIRAEEREKIAAAIEAQRARFAGATLTGRARRDGYKDAARIARCLS